MAGGGGEEAVDDGERGDAAAGEGSWEFVNLARLEERSFDSLRSLPSAALRAGRMIILIG